MESVKFLHRHLRLILGVPLFAGLFSGLCADQGALVLAGKRVVRDEFSPEFSSEKAMQAVRDFAVKPAVQNPCKVTVRAGDLRCMYPLIHTDMSIQALKQLLTSRAGMFLAGVLSLYAIRHCLGGYFATKEPMSRINKARMLASRALSALVVVLGIGITYTYVA